MSKDVDATKSIEFGNNDDEWLPVYKCACGAENGGKIFFSLSIYRNYPDVCPVCGRKFYFESSIRIFEVKDDD